MSAFAEKLKVAGADTVGASLTIACIEAIKKTQGSAEAAWQEVGRTFGYNFIETLLIDMNGGITAKPRDQRPVEPRVVSAERLEKRRQLQAVVRSKYKNSLGVSWTDVGWHELHSLRRDGNEAAALLTAGGETVPNDGRTVGQVLGAKMVDSIIAALRAGS